MEGLKFVVVYEYVFNYDVSVVIMDDEIKFKFIGVSGWNEIEEKIIRSKEV